MSIRYIPQLDALRGISILSVLAFHADLLPAGFIGVDLFFVLSGYLITSILTAEHNRTGSIDFKAFYKRRIRRLFPALFTLLLLYPLLLRAVGADPQHALIPDLAVISYIANWVHIANKESLLDLIPTWSLAVEEQFYILWPLSFVFLLKRGIKVSNVVACLIAAVIIWRAALFLTGASAHRLYHGTDTRLDALLIGCLLALVGAEKLQSRWAFAVAILFLSAWATLGHGIKDPALYLGGLTTIALASATVIANAIRSGAFILHFRPLILIGKWSYSLYLWHMVGLGLAFRITENDVLAKATGLPFGCFCGLLSYYLIELRFQRGRTHQVAAAAKVDVFD